MIPLRILHAVAPAGTPDHEAVLPLVGALAAGGHAGALLVRGESQAGATPLIGCDPAWLAWVTGNRRRTGGAVAAWMPDLIHVHTLGLLPAALDLSRDLGLGMVASVQTRDEPHAARRLRDPRIAWVLVPTEDHRAHLLRRVGLDRDRVAVIPPAVVLPESALACRLEPSWRVGAIVRSPASLAGFIAAVAEVQAGGLPVAASLHAGGMDADGRRRVQESATAAGAQIDLEDGPQVAFATGLDVLALPGVDDHDLALLITAQAAGIPAIVAAGAGIAELVQDGVTALVIPPDDRNALADALRLLHDRARRSGMAAAARQAAGERYAAPVVAQATLATYKSALGSSDCGAKAEVSRTWRRLTHRVR